MSKRSWLDWIPWLFGGSVAAGAAWAIANRQGEEEAPEFEKVERLFADPSMPPPGMAEATIDVMNSQMGPSFDADVLARAPEIVPAIQVIGRIASGDRSVFATPVPARNLTFDKNLRGRSDPSLLRKQIVLMNYEDVRFFGSLMAIAWILSQGNKQAKALSSVILNWMYYHRWEVSPALQQVVVNQLVGHSCKKDPRLPFHQEGAYPEIDMVNPNNPAAPPVAVGGDEPVWPAYFGGSTYSWKKKPGVSVYGSCHEQDELSPDDRARLAALALNTKASPFFNWPTGAMTFPQTGPPGLLVEYAMARYMQFALVSLIDPKAGEAIGTTLIGSMNAAIGVAASAAGTAIAVATGASAAIPVVGWVTAAIGALATLFIGIFGVTAAIERTREARMTVCKQIANQLGAAWQLYGHAYPPELTQYLSGYRADLLIPRDSWNGIAHYDDIKDPLYNNYALCSSTTVDVCPQLPFFYLNIDFPLPVSVAQPMNNWLCVEPRMQGGIVVDWKKEEYPMPAYAKVVSNYIKSNPIMKTR